MVPPTKLKTDAGVWCPPVSRRDEDDRGGGTCQYHIASRPLLLCLPQRRTTSCGFASCNVSAEGSGLWALGCLSCKDIEQGRSSYCSGSLPASVHPQAPSPHAAAIRCRNTTRTAPRNRGDWRSSGCWRAQDSSLQRQYGNAWLAGSPHAVGMLEKQRATAAG